MEESYIFTTASVICCTSANVFATVWKKTVAIMFKSDLEKLALDFQHRNYIQFPTTMFVSL